MKWIVFFIAWCALLLFYWPLAVVALVMLPILWVVFLPFRLIAIVIEAILALLRAVLLLPARILGHRR